MVSVSFYALLQQNNIRNVFELTLILRSPIAEIQQGPSISDLGLLCDSQGTGAV